MLGAARSSLGGPALQRKLARRLQRKRDAGPAADGSAKGTSLPPPEYAGVLRRVLADKTPLVADPARPTGTPVALLDKDEHVHLLDLGTSEKFNQVKDPHQSWWKVKVYLSAKLDGGPHADAEGWVQEKMLGTDVNVKQAGTHTEEQVGKGRVTAAVEQVVEPVNQAGFGGDDMFSLSYEGKDAGRMRWLQFIWREVIGIDDKGASKPLTGAITTAVGEYQLTQGGSSTKFGVPKKENINTDSSSPTDPFMEAAGTADRTAESTTLYDQPGAGLDRVADAFAQGAKQVVSRAHAADFLVKDEKEVQFQKETDIEWSFTDKGQVVTPPKGKEVMGKGGAAPALPAPMCQRLAEQYPAFKQMASKKP